METSRAPAHARAYRARRPERTVLYRALAHHFDRFLLAYEERFQPTHGYLRRCVEPAVYRYLDCGIFDQGVARIRCPDCRHEFLVAFSCKLRGLCPSCHQKRELLWAAWVEEELLEDVPHRQVVFTIPKRLRIFFRYDRTLLGPLATCAWRALRLYFDVSFADDQITPGAVGFLQTSGELLNFHPHVHILVTDGGFGPDRGFLRLPRFNSRHLERLFRAEVLRMLVDKGLIGEETVRNLLAWRHSGFSVHGAVRVEDRLGAARLGRYMIRCPLALKRLSWNEDTAEVAYTARPTRRSGPLPSTTNWDVLEFIARVVEHIPEPSQQMTRYWGFYANAARGKRRKVEEEEPTSTRSSPEDTDDDCTRQARLSWAKLFRRVYEVDPLLCPFCGAEMRVLAFITDFATARAIRRSLKLPAQEPEPLAHGPPHEIELLDQIA
ncbi:MAG: transposase [Thermoanaerobaculia bacterium]